MENRVNRSIRVEHDDQHHWFDLFDNHRLHIQLYLTALENYYVCQSQGVNHSNCLSDHCRQIREFVNHANSCLLGNVACAMCNKFNTLLYLHAQECSVNLCPVRNCRQTKTNIRLGRVVIRHRQPQQHELPPVIQDKRSCYRG